MSRHLPLILEGILPVCLHQELDTLKPEKTRDWTGFDKQRLRLAHEIRPDFSNWDSAKFGFVYC